MKLLQLEIDKVRGIQHLLVTPDGGNFVIWGPNGSGKSAVVDAIDFLLTGRIQRLTGEGTGDISLSKHGPHIDHRAEETIVRAVVQLPGTKDPIELKRSIGKPQELMCSAVEDEELEGIIRLAKQGVHILSRREILKYITADANTRAREIQELLNVTEIEETRKSFVKVKGDCQKELANVQTAVGRAKSQVNATTQEQTFDKIGVLQIVNHNRSILGAAAISDLCSANLKEGVRAPTGVSQSDGINVAIFDRDIRNLQNTISHDSETRIEKSDKELREVIERIRGNPELMRTLKQLQLIKLGMGMIDDTGKCPLCDRAWPKNKLLEYLKSRMDTGRVGGEYQTKIGRLVTDISTMANRAQLAERAFVKSYKYKT